MNQINEKIDKISKSIKMNLTHCMIGLFESLTFMSPPYPADIPWALSTVIGSDLLPYWMFLVYVILLGSCWL